MYDNIIVTAWSHTNGLAGRKIKNNRDAIVSDSFSVWDDEKIKRTFSFGNGTRKDFERFIRLRHKKAEIERLASQFKEAEAYEPIFKATREQFFDMVITDGEIEIKVIPSAKGIKEEGEAMHHCVGGYYNKPDSLILSAKVNGNRVETIEVNLKDYKLIQSRGLQNDPTKYHERIVDLVNSNLDTIRVLDVNHKREEKRKLRKLRKAS